MSNYENARVALEAASRVHQKVAAGSGSAVGGGSYGATKGDIKVHVSHETEVLNTADAFLKWLNANGQEN